MSAHTFQPRARQQWPLKKWLLWICLALVAVLQIYPLIWLVFFSLKTNIDIYSGNIMWLPSKFIWENYAVAFQDSNVGVYLLNSVIVTAATLFFTLTLASMASYAIARMHWKLKQTVFNIFLLGMMIPLHAALLPVFLVLKNIHLLNTYWALIIPYVGFAIPLAVLLLTNYFKTIPNEMEESAVIDGASVWRMFVSIIFPLAKPAISTIMIFTYLSSWNELMFAVTFINKQKLKTLTVGLMAMVGQHSTEWGPIGAGLVVATIPTMLIYVLLSKQVQNGMIAGAVKG